MGMSASQARLLSLTSRMHDLEFEAQALQYTKLDLVDTKSEEYDKYLDALDSTKIQMTMVTPKGNEYVDVTYRNLISQSPDAVHSMYLLKDNKDRIILPEQIASKIDIARFQDQTINLDEFLEIVGRNYLYSGRPEISSMSQEQVVNEMRQDGNYAYWAAVFAQFSHCAGINQISSQNATDRNWLSDSINSGEVQLFKLTTEMKIIDGSAVNIFAKASLGTDEELVEVKNDELIAKATIEYEKAIDDINVKDTKLDLQLAQIDTQHNALKTEYDSIKQIVSKNIERSYKTFNA